MTTQEKVDKLWTHHVEQQKKLDQTREGFIQFGVVAGGVAAVIVGIFVILLIQDWWESRGKWGR